MMQRVGLAQAMMSNDPDLVVLDEPSRWRRSGGPPARSATCCFRFAINPRRFSLNSHLVEVNWMMVCDRRGDHGAGLLIATQGTLEELTVESQRYEIVIEGPAPHGRLSTRQCELKKLPRARPNW